MPKSGERLLLSSLVAICVSGCRDRRGNDDLEAADVDGLYAIEEHTYSPDDCDGEGPAQEDAWFFGLDDGYTGLRLVSCAGMTEDAPDCEHRRRGFPLDEGGSAFEGFAASASYDPDPASSNPGCLLQLAHVDVSFPDDDVAYVERWTWQDLRDIDEADCVEDLARSLEATCVGHRVMVGVRVNSP